MADDLQAMLSTIGEKFDMSFDEGDPSASQELKIDHHTSINPENRVEETFPVETHPSQPPTQSQKAETGDKEASEEAGKAFSVGLGEESVVQVPFLPLLEREEGDEGEQEKAVLEGETGVHFSCEEEEVEYYRSLSEKFEDALNKAHSRKSTSSLCQSEFMERQEHFQRRKQTTLTLLLQEKQRREQGLYRNKPHINANSHQILPHYTPIDKRYPAILADRTRRVEAWQAEHRRRLHEAEQQELEQMERWREEARERVGEVRSSEEYFETQQQWSDRRYKNIEETAKRQDDTLRAEASFRPRINTRSDHMMKKKTMRVPVYEKEPELKKLPQDPHCTFKPNLSKTLKRIP